MSASNVLTPLDEQIMRRNKGHWPLKPDHPSKLSSRPLFIDAYARANPQAGPVDPKLWAGFLEHMGRCIYGGIVDDWRAPSPKELLIAQPDGAPGWRKDVFELIKADGDLETPMLRWPGGNFVQNYHWQDGIGPVKDRPKRTELAWLNSEPNTFGTDEFIKYCRALKVEPYLCLNMGTGTLEEALAWIEYCNGTGDTHWANLRRKHTGTDEPHNVKYWGLGNEVWGPWQVGRMTQTEYSRIARMWAHAIKILDPTIKLVSCGNTGSTDWDREVLLSLIDFADYHSIHFYSNLGHDIASNVEGYEYEKNVFSPATAERNIQVCKSLIDLANIERAARQIPARDVKICFDEWNVWDESVAPGTKGGEQDYNFTDALGFVAWCNLLVRQSYDVPIACMAQTVNVLSPIHTKPDGVLLHTLYYPLSLFSRFMKNGHVLALSPTDDAYTGPSYPVWIQQMEFRPTYIDTVAMIAKNEQSSSAQIRVSVLNRHPSVDWPVALEFRGYKIKSVEVHELYHDDLLAVNTFENPKNVVPDVKKLSGDEWKSQVGKLSVRKHSWSFFMFDGELV